MTVQLVEHLSPKQFVYACSCVATWPHRFPSAVYFLKLPFAS